MPPLRLPTTSLPRLLRHLHTSPRPSAPHKSAYSSHPLNAGVPPPQTPTHSEPLRRVTQEEKIRKYYAMAMGAMAVLWVGTFVRGTHLRGVITEVHEREIERQRGDVVA